tara:strand:+ start:295 stop:615 length:321 start_codon:yes stop_codon:yes gene_type:complete
MAVVEVSQGFFDITSTQSDTTLINHKSDRGAVRSISVSNQHASTTAVFDLYLDDELGSGNNIYIIKGVNIPAGVTLVLEDVTSFNNDVYSMKFTNAGGAPLSLIMR